MKVNLDLTQYEGAGRIKSVALAFLNYDFTECELCFYWIIYIIFPISKDNNNIRVNAYKKKVFWKYLGSIFSVVIWQLLSVWEVSLTLPFVGRSGVLSFGWTTFLRSMLRLPAGTFHCCAGLHSSHSFPFHAVQEQPVRCVHPPCGARERTHCQGKRETETGQEGLTWAIWIFYSWFPLCPIKLSGPPRAAPLLGIHKNHGIRLDSEKEM